MSFRSWLDRLRSRVFTGRHCPACGAQVSATARTCFMCGTNLPVRRRSHPGMTPLDPGTVTQSPVRRGLRALVARLQRQRTCPHCGLPVSRKAKICSACEREIGLPAEPARLVDEHTLPDLPSQVEVEHRHLVRRCLACGARISQDAQICPMCKADLNRVALEHAVSESVSEVNAQSGADYTPVSGTLVWADGDDSDKYIDVPLVTDNVGEDHEYFFVNLSSVPGSPAILGSTIDARIMDKIVSTSGSSGSSGGGGAVTLWTLCALLALALVRAAGCAGTIGRTRDDVHPGPSS